MASMTFQEEQEARVAIERVFVLYAHLLDDQRMPEWGELFCTDAIWTYCDFRFVGRDKIVAGVGPMEPKKVGAARHFPTAAIIDFEGDEAYSWSDAIAFTVEPEANTVVSVGRYHDVLRKEGGRWRIYKRTFVPSGDPLPNDVRPTPSR